MASQGIMSSGIKVGASAVCATSQKAPRKESGKLGFDFKKRSLGRMQSPNAAGSYWLQCLQGS